jgi:hypothetical protein
MEERFFGLEPSPPLADFIRGCKARVFEAVGPQPYLADAPHLTLYVGSFDREPELLRVIGELVPTAPVGVDIRGWETFRNDPVTGGHTLVLELGPRGTERLRDLQARVVAAANPFRAPGILPRYRDPTRYSPEMIESLAFYGFPFVGKIWRAHLTIASLAPAAYAAIAPALLALAPPQAAAMTAQAFNRIEAVGFVPLHAWDFAG